MLYYLMTIDPACEQYSRGYNDLLRIREDNT
jgi:hypothetical protein